MVRREQLRLRRLFERIAVASIALPIAQACAGDKTKGVGSDEPDATLPDATSDAAGANTDVPDAGRVDSPTIDAGLDSRACEGEASLPYVTDASYVDDSGVIGICSYFVDLPCGYQTKFGMEGCNFYLGDCASICKDVDGGFVDCLYAQGAGCDHTSVTVEAGEPATIACEICRAVGRRPAGLSLPAPSVTGATTTASSCRQPTALGQYFARAAHLEAASVIAFERLRDELRAHGAPQELIHAASRAAYDEVRHARVTSRIARRYGAQTCPPRVRRGRVRTLESVALENAVEGCVRETFGALMATWQAAHARDAQLRRSMRRIARDETRHAALAWAVARWAETRLGARALARIARARRAAARELVRAVSVELPAAAAREAGLPSARRARALAAAMSKTWE
jgi:hypothetical protein